MRDKGIWKILAILIVLVMVGSCAAMPSAGDVSESEVKSSSATIYVPDDYSTIQEAVNGASPRDIIRVRDGNYSENIKVTKRLTIQSENGAANCIVKAANLREDVFKVFADHVNISGFTVTGVPEWEWPLGDGISLYSANYCNISNNNVSNRDTGIYIEDSNNNTLANNNINLNIWWGIDLFRSSNNTLTSNNVSNNDQGGINLDGSWQSLSSNNILIGNNLNSNNRRGISVWESNNNKIISCNFEKDGLLVAYSNGNDVRDCYVNGKPLIYLENEKDKTVTHAGQVILVDSRNITIKGCNFSDTNVGIELSESSDNFIENNTVSNTNDGIYLHHSSDNTLTSNTILNNDFGIRLWSSGNTRITSNTFVNDGLSVEYSFENVVEDNTVNGKPLVYLEDATNQVLTDAGQVILINCNNITAEYLDLSNASVGIDLFKTNDSKIMNINAKSNRYGIYLRKSYNNTIINNTASDNIAIYLHRSSNNTLLKNNASNSGAGIILGYSNNNTLIENNISNNGCGIDLYTFSNNTIMKNNISNNWCGISLAYVSNDKIYLNNFINNTDNVYSYESHNIWNSTEKITCTYNGSTYTNYLGNYWEDYKGIDADGDGIGDTAYRIDGDRDRYPLMEPWENYAPTIAPTVIYVPDDYATIQAAVNAASADDIIIVRDGTYIENINVDKSLTIRSENGPDLTIVGAEDPNNHVFNVTAGYVNISGFTVKGADTGIHLYNADYCNISNNICSFNDVYGIDLLQSNNNSIFNNICVNNDDYGLSLWWYSNNNSIFNNTCSNNDFGIYLYNSGNNLIKNNNVSNNGRVITSDFVTVKWGNGIYLFNSSSNKIYLNNFINNTENVYSSDSTNTWNSPSEMTYTYNGSTYTNYLGNYWSDYTGIDADGDGIVDTPYVVDSDKDYFPLTELWEIYLGLIPTPMPPTPTPSAEIYVPDDYATIQVAVNAASAGDIIIVRDGTYIENIKVDKSLTIRSENGPDSTIVRAEYPGDHVFNVTADYVNISGFTVEGATGGYIAGIYLEADYCNISSNNCFENDYGIILDYSNHNSISNNICSNNWDGIYLWYSNNNSMTNNICSNNAYGISLSDSNNNSISNNICSNNGDDGIHLRYSNNNEISNNTCSNNYEEGIFLWISSNNKLRNNIMFGNGISIYGSSIKDRTQDIDTSNKVNGKPVYYWKDVEGGRIPDGAGQVILVNCKNVIVENQTLSDATIGMQLSFSSYITIRNNYCLNNMYGIYLIYSNNNSISNNNCSNNRRPGIYLYNSNNNSILNNNCSNNQYRCGIWLRTSSNNSMSNNVCLNNWDGIWLFSNSNNNSISNNNCSLNNWCGINLLHSSNNNISNNNCSNNRNYGIGLVVSSNSIINNNCSNNRDYGIHLSHSNNNTIYLNNFINNTYNVYSSESTNTWNSTERIPFTYNETPYTHYLGNYWEDYKGNDTNNDGIGDTPYCINSDKDNYPLVEPWQNYFPEKNKAKENKNQKLAFSSYYQPINISTNLSVPPYPLPLNLSNVTNINETNAKFWLSEREKELLRNNGFVITDYGNEDDIVAPYKSMKRRDIPIFVTTDTLLHLYHIQFNEILKGIEEREFFDELVDMSNAMLEQSIQDYENFTDPEMKEAARRNAAYFAVALKLLQTPTEGYDGTEDIKEIDFTIPDYVKEDVDKEIENIEQHGGRHPSVIFNSDPNCLCGYPCCYCEDYSQYVPRGHYTRSEKLKRYFNAMMWYGRMAFLLKGGDEALISEQDAKISTIQAALISSEQPDVKIVGKTAQEIWDRIYSVTAFFVGTADDLTPYEYQDAMNNVFGAEFNASELSTEDNLLELKVELAKMRSPKIYGGSGVCVVYPPITKEKLYKCLNKTKGMRFMGQRFVPDSYMFDQLVSPAVGMYVGNDTPFTMCITDAGRARCFPRGLDIMAVLGSERAEDILIEEGDTEYAGINTSYDEQLNELKSEFGGFDITEWNRNLYWSWLYTLKPLLKQFGDGYPAFMQTRAWQEKELQTSLASWTELRHDTILYAKQSYTPPLLSMPPQPKPVVGYVEPIPEFYARLLALTRMTGNGLVDLDVLNETEKARLQSLERILERLINISKAELENKELTENDYEFIRNFGERLDYVVAGVDVEGKETTIVADVHTDCNTGKVLEEGVGYVNLILVAYNVPDGRIIVGAGPVFSYYEFKQPMDDRLTNKKWKKMLRSNPPERPGWAGGIEVDG